MLSFIKNEQVHVNVSFNAFKQQVTKNLNNISIEEQLIFAMFRDGLSIEETVTEITLIHREL